MVSDEFEKDDEEIENIPESLSGDIDPYVNMVMEEPEREVELPQHDGHKSLTEVETESPNLTDMQAALKRLFPKFVDPELDKLANAIMVARIHPESYMDMIVLTVVDILESHCTTDNIDVVGTLNLVTAIFSIGLEGKGRFDGLELAGAAKEAEIEKLSERLGFAG